MIFKNVKWRMKQTSVYCVARASLAYLDKHSTLDPVMVIVVCYKSHWRQLFTEFFVNFYSLIVKKSNLFVCFFPKIIKLI